MGQIVATTFPRSGSRFAAAVLTSHYGAENYVEGMCRLHLLKRDNAFTIIRKPEEAIPSWVAAVENHFDGFANFTAANVVDESIPFYVEWMERTLDRMGHIYVTTFEAFTQATQTELDKVSEHFDLPMVTFDPTKFEVDPRHIPGGNPPTARAESVLSHPDFPTAQQAYQLVRAALL